MRTLMKLRDRIAASAWVVVCDAHAAEDIFQNVALKALTKEISFEAEGALLSWAFITARREGIDWLRWHRKELTGLDPEILELLEQEWLCEPAHRDEGQATQCSIRFSGRGILVPYPEQTGGTGSHRGRIDTIQTNH